MFARFTSTLLIDCQKAKCNCIQIFIVTMNISPMLILVIVSLIVFVLKKGIEARLCSAK